MDILMWMKGLAGSRQATEVSDDAPLPVAVGAGTSNIGDVDVVTQPGAVGFAHEQVSVGVAVTAIVPARATRRSVTILNMGAGDVFIGGGTVSTANGFRLKAGESLVMATTGAISGIAAAAQTVAYMEEFD